MFKKLPQYSKQDLLIGLLLVGIFILGFVITYLSLSYSSKISGVKEDSFAEVTPAPLNEENKEEGIYSALFMGYGGAGHAGSLLIDSIIVLRADTNSKKVLLVSIPRDLWVPGNRKINAEASANGFENVDVLVQSITGLPINYYVAVDFAGLTKIIDTLGGITVIVPNTFRDSFYPLAGEENNTCGKTENEINELKAKYSGFELEKQFTCRYETISFEKGEAKLDGATALKFVRSRHGDSDFGRSARQFAVLIGIKNRLLTLEALTKATNIIDTLLKMVKTDLGIGEIKALVDTLGDPLDYTVKEINLSTDNVLNAGTSGGQFILTPKSGNFNFSGIKEYIKQNLN